MKRLYKKNDIAHAITTRLPRWKKLIDCEQVMIQLQPNHQTLVNIASSRDSWLKDYTIRMTLYVSTTRLPRWKQMIDCELMMIQLQPYHQTLVKRASSLPGGVLKVTLA